MDGLWHWDFHMNQYEAILRPGLSWDRDCCPVPFVILQCWAYFLPDLSDLCWNRWQSSTDYLEFTKPLATWLADQKGEMHSSIWRLHLTWILDLILGSRISMVFCQCLEHVWFTGWWFLDVSRMICLKKWNGTRSDYISTIPQLK